MTTPDPQDFVLDAPTGDEPPQNLLLTALTALSQAFTVTPPAGPPGGRRRRWLDTFDWRLYRAGLMLEFEQARRGGRLLLSRTDGTLQAEQPVTGWPPRRPALDLPPGPVRDRIMVLIRPRALLPIVRAASTVSVARLLNADGKTVARLVAENITVTTAAAGPATVGPTAAGATAAGTTAELPLRLAITEVRGYPGQARRAATLLAGLPGVSYASQSVFTAALTALGRHPSDYTSGVDAEITASMPASVAVARLLLRLLDTLEQNVDGVLRDIDTEFLHDLRVAVRRTRSAIKLLGEVLPADLAEYYKTEFKWLGDLTTPTRDLDVHLLGFDAMTGQLVAASPATSSRSAPSWSGAAPASSGGWPRRCAARGSAPSSTTGARRCSRSATPVPRASAAGRPPQPSWRCARPSARSVGSRRRAPRSPRARPPNPYTTCVNAPRSCATCWSSSPVCTTRSRTGRWSAT